MKRDHEKPSPKPKKERIKCGCVSLPFYPWTDPGSGRTYCRWSWKDPDGKWKYGTRANKEEAKEAAKIRARSLSRGTLDLETLSASECDLVLP